MKSLIALLLASSMLLCTNANAKKVPPPAPNIAASLNLNLDFESDGAPLVDVNISMSATHSFYITPEQEAALQPDAVVTVNSVNFTLSDDPNFNNGDKSATFEALMDVDIFNLKVPSKVTLKWNKGKMTVTLKGNLKEKDLSVEEMTARLSAAKEREAYPFLVVTEISHSSIPSATIIAPLACDFSASQTSKVSAEGAEYTKFTQSLKSKGFSDALLP